MAVAVVETFLNIFFRLKVKEPSYAVHESYVLQCFATRKTLEFKLKNWPKKILGANINDTDVGKRFSKLKTKRNELMHFIIPDDPVKVKGVTLRNFSEITFYNDLSESDADDAVKTVEDFIQKILESSGLSNPRLTGRMLFWTGRPPA